MPRDGATGDGPQTSASERPQLFCFSGGDTGPWKIESIQTVVGNGLSQADRLSIATGTAAEAASNAIWTLRGFTSNARYTQRNELANLSARQQSAGRPTDSRAALIPIRKNKEWWSLAQDERRMVFEAQSKHITLGMEYLPAIARRLHHCRDLGEEFDFLTWFEYAPEHSEVFEMLVARLRETDEWRYVDREVDIRLVRR